MSETKRIRIDLDKHSYEVLHYFGLLRGRPMGHTLREILARHAASVEEEFPPVRAHILAWEAARLQEPVDPGSPNVEGVPF